MAQGISFGVVPLPTPGLGGELARRAEALGFDACLFPDTQNLAGDPYSASCLGAHATSRIRLGPGVTNPVTRLPAVTASAIGTVHLESRGRAVLGLGRGDSSAAHAGVPAATTETLESYARTVQAYLRGETVAGPELDSGIGWLTAAGLDKVPLDMACTGPRTIQVAARVADRVSFAVGAAPERLRWALGVAREALAEARRDPEEVQFGAYLNIVADPSLSRARALARTGVGLVAHFSAMKGSRPDALPPQLRPVAERLATSYEMARHGRGNARQSQIVDDAFVDWFAIAGEPAYCVDRLRELSELGLRHVYVIGGAEHEGSLALVDAHELFAEKVMAVLR